MSPEVDILLKNTAARPREDFRVLNVDTTFSGILESGFVRALCSSGTISILTNVLLSDSLVVAATQAFDSTDLLRLFTTPLQKRPFFTYAIFAGLFSTSSIVFGFLLLLSTIMNIQILPPFVLCYGFLGSIGLTITSFVGERSIAKKKIEN